MTKNQNKAFVHLLVLSSVLLTAANHGYDRFNYGVSDFEAHDYGPKDWNMVECNDVETCVSVELDL